MTRVWSRRGKAFHRRCSRWASLHRLERLEDRTLFSASPLSTAAALSFTPSQTAHAAGYLSLLNETASYKVHLGAGDRVSAALSAVSMGSTLQGSLEVLDSAGNPVASDAQEGGDPRLSFQASAAGDYVIEVSSLAIAPNGMYSLDLRRTLAAPLQPDLAGASFRLDEQTAAWGDTVTGSYIVENRGGADAGPFTVEVLLSPDNLFGPSAQVLASYLPTSLATGGSFAQDAFSITLPSSGSANFPSSGPVYLGLRIVPAAGDSGSFDKSGVHRGEDYETLTIVTPVTNSRSRNHSLSSALNLTDLNSRVNASFGGGADWYQLTLTSPGELNALIVSSDVNFFVPRLALDAADGSELLQSDGASANPATVGIQQHLDAGTYYLVVSAQSGLGANYTLTTTFVAGQSPVRPLPVGTKPVFVTIADLNNDGIPDLIVANNSDNTVSVLLGNPDGSYQSQQTYSVGASPDAMAAADLTGNGKLDLIVANFTDGTLSVLMGNGNGTFQPAVNYTVGHEPDYIAVADFNGDGIPDLAVANYGAASISVLTGNGDGTFQPQTTYAVGASPSSVAAGDLTGDGIVDLAVANRKSNTVGVLLGNGDGTFRPQQSYPVGVQPRTVVIADLSGDGKPDLAVSNLGSYANGSVSVLLSNGDGTFQSQQSYPVGTYPDALAVADVNGDGRPDLIAANYGDDTVSVLLNTGQGAFAPPKNFRTGSGAISVTVADLQGDGRLDIVTANRGTSQQAATTVSILLGNGDGTFQEQQQKNAGVGSNPRSVAVGDVNGDGRPDLVVANRLDNTVSVLLGNGDGTFQNQPSQIYHVGKKPRAVAVADVNGDGKPDLIVADFGDSTVSVLLGNGDGSFQDSPSYLKTHTFFVGSGPVALAVADVNGDGKPDLVVANYYDDTVSVLLGNGDGTFQTQQVFAVDLRPNSVAVADLNGDGKPDIVTADYTYGGVSVLLGKGDGTFQDQQVYHTGTKPRSVVVADFNGDGKLDLAVANYGDKTITVLPGNGDGTFGSAQYVFLSEGPFDLAAADLNGDGKPDLVSANYGTNTVSVLLGNGDGSFAPEQTIPVGASPFSVAVADVNGDHRPDIVVTNAGDDSVSVLLGNGTGFSYQTQSVSFGVGPDGVAVADLNGDGFNDIVTANYGSNTVSVLLGKGHDAFQPQQVYPVGISPNAVLVADLAGDGIEDIITANYGDNTVSVLMGNGDGTFQHARTYKVGKGTYALALAHLTGDGKLDIVTANETDGTVTVLLGNGDGTFQDGPGYLAAHTFAVGSQPHSVAVADVTGDGIPDIVTANYGDGTISVLPGNGDGTFAKQQVMSVGSGPPSGANSGTGSEPASVVAADLRGDGHEDLVVANYYDNTVSVLLGDGHGGFGPQQVYSVGNSPNFVAVTVLSGDSHPDIVTANELDSTVSVLPGDGTGAFGQQQLYNVGTGPIALTLGDVTGDGGTDIITANYNDDTLSILPANHSGGFLPQQTISLAAKPRSVTVADLSGDGKSDLIVADYGAGCVSVSDGNGGGTFGTPQIYPVGAGPKSVTVADLRGDGILDLVVVNYGSNTISVLLGNGDGTFRDQKTYAVGTKPVAVAVADLTGDGIPDILVANDASGTVSVLLGNGDGTFRPQQTVAVGVRPSAVAVADVTGDGIPDLITTNYGDNTVSVLPGHGDGTFGPETILPTGARPISMAVADINGDGKQDIVVANYGSSSVSVLRGNGDGTFQTQQTYSVGTNPKSVVVADVNGDGFKDIVVANEGDDTISVLPGAGAGTFLPAQTFGTGSKPKSVTVADLSGDGKRAIVVANYGDNTISVLLAGQTSVFTPAPSSGQANLPNTPLVADLNHDGIPDGVILDRSGDILYRRGLSSDGTSFAPPVILNPDRPARDIAVVRTGTGWAVAAADLLADPTLSSPDHYVYTVSLYTLAADGSVNRSTVFSSTALPTRIVAGNLVGRISNPSYGTGLDSLVVANALDNSVTIVLQSAPGQFADPITRSVGATPTAITLPDVNGDGRRDILVANATSGTVSVLLNDSTHSFNNIEVFRAGTAASDGGSTGLSLDQSVSLTTGNALGSGRNDIVVVNRGSHTISVLANDGNGGFLDPALTRTSSTSDGFTVNNQPGPVVAGDFDGDGHLDLAILMEDRAEVWIFTGDGQGHFFHTFTIAAGESPTGLSEVRDPQTGLLDLLVGNDYGDVLRLEGQPDGTFRTPPPGDSVSLSQQTVGGQTQVLLANQQQNHVLVETRVPGSDQFVPSRTVAIAGSSIPFAPSTAQWSMLDQNSALPDAVVLGASSNSLQVYRLSASGQGYVQTSYPVGTDPVGLTIADVNGDGIPDMIVANRGSNDVSILFGAYDAQGHWIATAGPRLRSGGFGPIGTTLSDVTGDGIPDLVVTNGQSGSLAVLPGRGQGFFDDRNPVLISMGGIITQAPVFGADGLGVAVTADGRLVGVNENNLGAGADMLFAAAGQDVLAAQLLNDGNVVAAEAGGMVALLAAGASGFELTQTLTPLSGIPLEPSALAVLESVSGMQVLVTSAGQDTVFVFAPETQTPSLPAPSVPQSPIAVPSALEEAPLVLVVALTAPALPEGTSTAATTPLPAAGPNAVAGVAGGDVPEEGRFEPLAFNEGGREGKEPIPGLDEALRRLRLYRPMEPLPAGPRSEWKGPEEEELDAEAAMVWEVPLHLVDGGPGRTGLLTRPDGSGEPSYGSNLPAGVIDDVPTTATVHQQESVEATGGESRLEPTDASPAMEQRSVWRRVVAALASIGLCWWKDESERRKRRLPETVKPSIRQTPG
jgi:hypothetical protein